MSDAKTMVNELIERARVAQEVAESFSQERVDELVKAIAWDIVQEDTAKKLATLASQALPALPKSTITKNKNRLEKISRTSLELKELANKIRTTNNLPTNNK